VCYRTASTKKSALIDDDDDDKDESSDAHTHTQSLGREGREGESDCFIKHRQKEEERPKAREKTTAEKRLLKSTRTHTHTKAAAVI
jgi:hypothetical protein